MAGGASLSDLIIQKDVSEVYVDKRHSHSYFISFTHLKKNRITKLATQNIQRKVVLLSKFTSIYMVESIEVSGGFIKVTIFRMIR